MSRKPDALITGPGYTKFRGEASVPKEMSVHAQSQVGIPGEDDGIFIRIGSLPKTGDRALDDLEENTIRLTLDQARELLSQISEEIENIEHFRKDLKGLE